MNLDNRYNNGQFFLWGNDEMMGTGVILPWQGLKSTERARSKQQATQLQVRLIISDEE